MVTSPSPSSPSPPLPTCTGHKPPTGGDGSGGVGTLEGLHGGQLLPLQRPHSEALHGVGHDELASGRNPQGQDVEGQLHHTKDTVKHLNVDFEISFQSSQVGL